MKLWHVLILILVLPEFICSSLNEFFGKPKYRKKREVDALDVGELEVDDSDINHLKFKFHIAVNLSSLKQPSDGRVWMNFVLHEVCTIFQTD